MQSSTISRLVCAAVLAATASCAGSGTTDNKPIAVDAVELSATSATLALNEQRQFTATPRANGQALTDRAVTWATADVAVATVSTTGLVVGIRAGTTNITATSETKSATAAITVNNPAPTIANIAPTNVLATSAQFTLTISGTNFVNGSTVQWNGAARATTFVSATSLTATISATDVAAAGTAQITVATVAPGGGTSASASFTITAQGPLVLSTHQLNSSKLNDTLGITVTRDGRTVIPTLSLRTERRWLTEFPILTAAALASGRLVTSGVGRAVVSVVAEGLTDSVVVDVALTRPLVTSVTGPVGHTNLGADESIVVRGFGMDKVTRSQLFDASLRVINAQSDSANLRVTTTLLGANTRETCTGRPQQYKLTPIDVDLAVPTALPYTRGRIEEMSLAVGESRTLDGAMATCFRIPPGLGNARYLIAFVDSRRIRQAETSFEFPVPPDMTFRVDDRSGPPASAQAALRNVRMQSVALATAAAPSVGAPPVDKPDNTVSANRIAATAPSRSRQFRSNPHLAQADQPFQACTTTPTAAAWAVYCRATPWTVGATFNYQPIVSARAPGTAHIIAVSPKVVAAVFDADQALLQPLTLTRIQATIDYMSSTYMGVLQQYFKTTRPVISSLGSSQLVVMFEAGNNTNNIRSPGDAAAPGGTYSIVSMLLSATNCYGAPATCSFVGADEIVIHETTHAYQFLWNLQTRNGVQPFGQTWSLEGGAGLQELLAPLAVNNIAWDANTSFESFPVGDGRRAIGAFANGNLSQFTLGYRSSAAFFRHLIQRLVKDKGMAFNDALTEVQIGAIEGWYGIGSGGVILGQGLVPRMRAKFGASWDPVHAMLEWTMADAADDLTANPLFQDLTSRTSPREFGGVYQQNGFKPYAGITAGSGTFGEITLPAGNTGVFQLEDPSVGGSFTTSVTVGGAPMESQASWLILRIR